MPRRPVVLAVLGVIGAAGVIAAATAITLREGRDPGCSHLAYGCVVFEADEPVQIGVLVTTSGRGGAAGSEALRGARLAVETWQGRIEGRPVHLLTEDDRCDRATALRGARELASDPLDEPPVVAVIGGVCPGTTGSVAQILSDSGIPLVSWSTEDVAFRDPPRSFLVRIPAASDPQPRRAFAEAFRGRFGGPPKGETAFRAYHATRLVIAAVAALARPSDPGEVLVPRLPLLDRLLDLALEPAAVLATPPSDA